MLGATSGSKLLWNRRDQTERKEIAIWIGFNYLSTKITWKFQLKNQLSIYPEITWNYPNINFHRWKIKNPHLNSKSLSKLEKSETEFILKQFLKKPDLWWKLTSPTLTNVKSISSHCRRFQLTIFNNNFHKQAAPHSIVFSKFYGPITISMCPEITLNQLEH